MNKKIKRLKLKGTEAWIDGDGYEIRGEWAEIRSARVLPVDHYDIEYKEKTPQPDYEGFCNYHCPFAGDREDYIDPKTDTYYTRCSRYNDNLYAWAEHYCPDAVELKE